jgi:hypothetical protein
MSLKTLRSKVDFIINAMSALQASGKVDHSLLRRVGKICSQLPDLQEDVTSELDEELVYCMMMVYSTLAAKNTSALHELLEKYTSTFSRRGGIYMT